MKHYQGYYWPDEDTTCHEAVVRCVHDLEAKWEPHFKGRHVAVQAGGNCGVYPLWLSMRFSQVYTFEPDQMNFQCLLLNCKGVENIQARCAALGSEDGRLVRIVQKVPHNVGSHFVDPKHPGNIPETTVDALKLDACDLIALDVEGYELRALHGAERTIDLFHPVVIYERKHGGRYGEEHESIPKWLRRKGYTYRTNVERDEIWS